MASSCGICGNNCRDGEIRCGGCCDRNFHMKCVGLSKYECDAIFKHQNIKYMCEDCIDFIKKTNENYKHIISLFKENEAKISSEINKTNKLMEKKMEEAKTDIISELKTKQAGDEKETYASKLKATNTLPVILRPKNKQNSELTEREVKEKIKPSTLDVSVKGMVRRNDGAIAIRCENENDRSILTDKIKEQMGSNYEVQTPKMRNPKILVTGLKEELNKESIINAIIKQNDIECDKLECVKVYKSFKNPKIYNAIVETDQNGFNQIMAKKKINIEWDRCMVYESCNVLRCFKCWGFNHTSKYCRNEHQICAKCSESGHTYKECQNNIVKCINCENAKVRLNMRDIDTNHDCRNTELCKILQRKNKLEAERTAY